MSRYILGLCLVVLFAVAVMAKPAEKPSTEVQGRGRIGSVVKLVIEKFFLHIRMESIRQAVQQCPANLFKVNECIDCAYEYFKLDQRYCYLP